MASTLVRKVMLKITSDDGDTEAKLEKISEKADELARKHPDLKVKIDTGAASAKLAVLRAELKHTADEEKKTGDEASGLKGKLGSLGGLVNGLTLGLSRGWSEMSMFQKVMFAMNIATGIAEPLMAGLIVTVGGLAAGLVAAGGALGAFGLVAKANFTAASTAATAVQTAQNSYTSAVKATNAAYAKQLSSATTATQRAAAGTARASGLQAAYKAKVDATAQAYANLTPAQVALSKQVGAMSNQWQGFTASFAPMLSKLMGQVRPLFSEMLPDIRKLATAGFTGISTLLTSLGGANTGGFTKFINMLANNAPVIIVRMGMAIGNVAKGIGGILKAFMPVSQGLFTGLDSLTAKFAKWGQTLTGHSGFKDLMAMFKSETPQAITVLKQLASIVKIVASQMTGMDTFGNSKMFLTVAVAVTKLVNSLLKAHPELIWLVLYAKLGSDALGKLKGAFTGLSGGISDIRSAGSAVKNLHAGLKDADQAAAESTGAWGTFGGKVTSALKGTKQGWNDFRSGFSDSAAAESAFSGKMGTLGGKVKEAFSSMGSAASSAGSAIVSGMSSAWSGITSGIGTAITAVKEWTIWSKIAALGTKIWTGVQAAFDAVMDANPIAIIIIAVIALVAGIVLLVTHCKAFRDFWIAAWHDVTHIISVAFDWVKSHWPLLLAILTGPIGLAVLEITRHWHEIEDGVREAFRAVSDAVSEAIDWVRSHWPLVLSIITGPIGAAVIFVVRHWHQIEDGARSMLSNVVGFFRALPGRIIAAISSLAGMLFRAGQNVMKSLISGLTSMIGAVGSAVGGIAKKVAGFFGLSPAKEGPLAGGGAPEIRGAHFAAAFASGMLGSEQHIRAAAQRLAQAAGIGPGDAAAGGAGAAAGPGGDIQVRLTMNERQLMEFIHTGLLTIKRGHGLKPDTSGGKLGLA